NKLNARQLLRIWLHYWNDRWKEGTATKKMIVDNERAKDPGEFIHKNKRFYEYGDRNALGPQFADAVADIETAEAVFRQAVYIMGLLTAAESQGRSMTLREVTEAALIKDKIDWSGRAGGMFLGAVPRVFGTTPPRLPLSGGLPPKPLSPGVATRMAKTTQNWLITT